jgi:hypothetical protein
VFFTLPLNLEKKEWKIKVINNKDMGKI